MKIENISILRGPNYWSIERDKLIQMRLNLGRLEQFPTNKINGFSDRIQSWLPSMHSHRCSEGVAGGFFTRVKEGTWMGHVIEHIALEIQTLAGMDTGFGRTRETNTSGTYNVVFAYQDEQVGVYAAKAAVRIAEALISNSSYSISADVETMAKIWNANKLGPSTQSIINEAEKRKIPWSRLNQHSYIQLGYGKNQVRLEATITENTNYMAVEIACNKFRTKQLLKDAFVPIADGGLCKNQEELKSIIEEIGYPIVIKPYNCNHGRGVTTNINLLETAEKALQYAQEFSQKVIVEKFVEGHDFRVLVINKKVVAAAKRIPAHVIGDGKLSINELILIENNNPNRGEGHEQVLTKIKVDQHTISLLKSKNYDLQSIPKKDEIIYLKSTANLSTGGTSIDVTDELHPDNILLAERIAKVINLDICGIDIIASNLSASLYSSGGVVIEVNAAPGFRMHLSPTKGIARNVASSVVDMLFPPQKSTTIPIIAVTGTNGKTTTTRLIAHLFKQHKKNVGYTTSDGIYIQNKLMEKGDTTGPISARKILNDPTIDIAVLETARGGILREGLAFRTCDIGIITNITEDHLGLKDIHSLEQLARVKSVVVESVKKEGWAILNAEDQYSMKISKKLECQIAYFSLDEKNIEIQNNIRNGSTVAFYTEDAIVIQTKTERICIADVSNIPLTMNGKAAFMIQNVLAAVLAAYLSGIDISTIRTALETFFPSPKLTPGRMNIFQFKEFKILIDFAHNPAGYIAIKDYLSNVKANKKIGIISGVGDRRDEDIQSCGRIAAEMFDYIIIRQERHLRGRTEKEIIQLLVKGINEVQQDFPYEIIPNEIEAIEHTIKKAEKGDFIVALSDAVSNAIDVVQFYLDKDS
ncbi:cyanophycin synthetase [Empedobacter falsenii]